MKAASARRIVATLAVLATSVAVLVPRTPVHAQIVRAAWLSGCWEARSAERVVEEQWMAPRGRSMLALDRTVHLDTLVDCAEVVLREKNGRLEYERHAASQPMAVFLSTEISESSLLFENPLNSDPQRIGYARRGADSLIVSLDTGGGLKRRRVEIRYAKVRCGT